MAQGINNKESNSNLSDDFDDFNLENELNTVPGGQQNNFELGGSVTKEMLHETNKQINEDNLDDDLSGLGELNNFDNNMNDVLDDLQNAQETGQTVASKGKKNLQIDIDENADYDQQNDLANQQLNDKLLQNQ